MNYLFKNYLWSSINSKNIFEPYQGEFINKREDPKIYLRFESSLQRGFKYTLKKGSPTQKRFTHSQQGLLRLTKKIFIITHPTLGE